MPDGADDLYSQALALSDASDAAAPAAPGGDLYQQALALSEQSDAPMGLGTELGHAGMRGLYGLKAMPGAAIASVPAALAEPFVHRAPTLRSQMPQSQFAPANPMGPLDTGLAAPLMDAPTFDPRLQGGDVAQLKAQTVLGGQAGPGATPSRIPSVLQPFLIAGQDAADGQMAGAAQYPPNPEAAQRGFLNPMRYIPGAIENAPQLIAQTVFAYLTGGTSAAGRLSSFVVGGVPISAAQGFTGRYQAFREQGRTPDEAAAAAGLPAVLDAIGDSVLDGLGGGAFFKDAVGKQTLKEAAKDYLLRGLEGFGKEGVTESLQEAKSAALDVASGSDPTAGELSKLGPRMLDAGVVGGLLGAPAAVGGRFVEGFQEGATNVPGAPSGVAGRPGVAVDAVEREGRSAQPVAQAPAVEAQGPQRPDVGSGGAGVAPVAGPLDGGPAATAVGSPTLSEAEQLLAQITQQATADKAAGIRTDFDPATPREIVKAYERAYRTAPKAKKAAATPEPAPQVVPATDPAWLAASAEAGRRDRAAGKQMESQHLRNEGFSEDEVKAYEQGYGEAASPARPTAPPITFTPERLAEINKRPQPPRSLEEATRANPGADVRELPNGDFEVVDTDTGEAFIVKRNRSVAAAKQSQPDEPSAENPQRPNVSDQSASPLRTEGIQQEQTPQTSPAPLEQPGSTSRTSDTSTSTVSRVGSSPDAIAKPAPAPVKDPRFTKTPELVNELRAAGIEPKPRRDDLVAQVKELRKATPANPETPAPASTPTEPATAPEPTIPGKTPPANQPSPGPASEATPSRTASPAAGVSAQTESASDKSTTATIAGDRPGAVTHPSRSLTDPDDPKFPPGDMAYLMGQGDAIDGLTPEPPKGYEDDYKQGYDEEKESGVNSQNPTPEQIKVQEEMGLRKPAVAEKPAAQPSAVRYRQVKAALKAAGGTLSTVKLFGKTQTAVKFGEQDKNEETGLMMALLARPNTIKLSAIHVASAQRGQGRASEMMRALTAAADTEGMDIALEAIPLPKGGMSTKQLRAWYEGFGFRAAEDGSPNVMVRIPAEPASGIPDADQKLQKQENPSRTGFTAEAVTLRGQGVSDATIGDNPPSGKQRTEKPAQDDVQTDSGGRSGAKKLEGRADTQAVDGDADPVVSFFAKRLGDAVNLSQAKPFDTIVDARKAAAELTGRAFDPGTPAAKALDEQIERAVVMVARDLVEAGRRKGSTPPEVLAELERLYNLQPNLAVRTSTSISQQAYSTPAPLAFLASRLAGVEPGREIFEPTAGNGMLLMEADPAQSTVNELNRERAESLRAQGFATTQHDAAKWSPADGSIDSIVANPPFGKVTNDKGIVQRFTTPFYKTTELDHAITLRALESLKDDGRAVFILGGKKGTDSERKTAYRNSAVAPFWHFLLKNYNVIDHFTVSGDLYAKQGAKFPVDVVVIDGRGQSSRELPGVTLPRVYDSWNALASLLSTDPMAAGDKAGGVATQGRTGGVDPSGSREAESDPRRVSGSAKPSGPVDDRSGSKRAVEDPGRAQSQPAESSARGPARSGSGDRAVASDGPATVPEGDSAVERPGTDRVDSDDHAERLAGRPDAQRPDVKASDLQLAYVPSAKKAKAIGTLAPKNLAASMSNALEQAIEQAGAPAESIVATELGMDIDDVLDSFSAEQIDALVLAIANVKSGKGFIIGDQTGVGKGRWVAGMLRWAGLNNMIPVFVTEKPNLFADILRDTTDIGMKKYELLPTNSDMVGNNVLKLEDGREVRSLPNVVDRLREALANFRAGRGLVASRGKQRVKFNAIATTYSQLQTVKGAETDRRQALMEIAPHAMFIFDESHNAGGQTVDERYKNEEAPPSRAEFARNLIGVARAVLYSSATYAKRPDVMDLYRATDMRLAVDKIENLAEAIKNGGLPMQQMVAEMLSRAGQYVRRERSFDGVDVDVERVDVDVKTADKISEVFRAINEFDRLKQEGVEQMADSLAAGASEITRDSSTGKGGVSSTTFSSLMHNVVSQMLFAMKVDASVASVKRVLDAGEKVVIAIDNTMETVLERARGNAPLGSVSTANFNAILRRYLERSREVLVKPPGGKKGDTYRHYMTDAELGLPAAAQFAEVGRLIDALDASSIPVSPIDRLIHLIEQLDVKDPETGEVRKVKVGEITGRSLRLDYSTPAPTFQERPASEQSAGGRIKAIRDYQAGVIDVMIVNPAGATGISMHTDKKRARDLRRRRMLVLQPNPNIDTQMQMFGRVHRAGQVNAPGYTFVVSDLPAENRPAAVLMKKLGSLNANVSADRKGAMSFDVPDVMNSVGDGVMHEILVSDPELLAALGMEEAPEAPDEESEPGRLVQSITGKLASLPIQTQRDVWARLETDMRATLDRLTKMGGNPLEAARMDLQAKPISRQLLKQPPQGSSPSPFTEPAYIETVETKVESKAMPAEKLWALVAEQAGEMGREKRRWSAQTMDETRKAFRAYWAEKSRQLSDGQRNYREALNDQMDRTLESAIHDLSPGMPVRFRNGSLGVVTNVRRRQKENPLAPSSWIATIAVADVYGSIDVPLSQYGGQRSVMVSAVETPIGEINAAFDEAARGGTQERSIVTGNMLAGYEAAGRRGNVAFYTTESGELRPGIVMPRDFKPEDAIAAVPFQFTTADRAAQYLAGTDGRKVVSQDAVLHVERMDGGKRYAFEAPKSKKAGGEYTLHRAALSAAGAEYVSVGNRMTMEVEASKVPAVLAAYMDTGTRFRIPTTAVEGQRELDRKVYRSIEGLDQSEKPAPTSTLDKIIAAADSAEDAARDRLRQSGIPRGRGAGAAINPIAELYDHAVIIASRVIKAGARGIKAINAAYAAAVSESGARLTPEAEKRVKNEAGRIIADTYRLASTALRKQGDSVVIASFPRVSGIIREVNGGVYTVETKDALVEVPIDKLVPTAGEAKADVGAFDKATSASRARMKVDAPPKVSPGQKARATARAQEKNRADVAEVTAPTTVPLGEAIKARLEGEDRAAAAGERAGFVAGEEVGKLKGAGAEARRAEKAATKTVENASEIAVPGVPNSRVDRRFITASDALRAGLRKAARAAAIGYRAGRDDALEKFKVELEAVQQRANDKAVTAGQMRARVAKLVRQMVPDSHVKRFLTAIAQTRTDKQVDQVATRVFEVLAESRMKLALADAKETAREVKIAKMLEEHRELLAAARKDIKALTNKLASLGTPGGPAKTPAAMDQIRTGLNDATGRARFAITQHRLAQKTHVAGKSLRTADAVAEVVAAIGAGPAPAAVGGVDGLPETVKAGWLRRVGLALATRTTVAEMIGSRVIKDLLVRQARKGENASNRLRQRAHDALMSILTKNGYEPGSLKARQLSEAAIGQGKAALRDVKVGGETVKMTPAMQMAVYAHLGDAGAGRNIAAGAPIRFRRGGKFTAKDYHMSGAEIRLFRRAMPADLKGIVDDAKAWYKANVTPEMAATFRRENGYDLQLVPGYHSTSRVAAPKEKEGGQSQNALTKDADAAADFTEFVRSFTPSMIKERDAAAVKAPYLIGDFFADWSRMVAHGSAYIHMTQPVREISRIMEQPEVRQALDRKYGFADGSTESGVMVQRIKDLAKDMQLVSSRRDPQTGLERGYEVLKRNLSRAVLLLNVKSMLRNLTGIVRLANSAGAWSDLSGLAKAFDSKLDADLMDAPFFRARYEQGAAVRATQMLGGGSDLLGRPSKAALLREGRLGLLTDRLPFYEYFDRRAATAAYGLKLAQAARELPDAHPAHRKAWALKRAEEAVRESQNPSSNLDLSGFARQQQGSLLSAVTMFANDGIAMLNMLMRAHAAGDAKTKAKAYGAVALSISLAAMVAPLYSLLREGIADAAGADEYRKKKAAFMEEWSREVAGQVGGLVYGGQYFVQLGEGLFDAIRGKPARDMDNPLAGPVGSTIGDAIASLMGTTAAVSKALDDLPEKQRQAAQRDIWRHAERLAIAGNTLAGNPLVAVYRNLAPLMKRAGEGADRATALDAAAAALKSGAIEDARKPVQSMMRGIPPAKRHEALTSIRDALEDRGPRGKLSRADWAKKLRSMTPEQRSAAIKDATEWMRKVGAVLKP